MAILLPYARAAFPPVASDARSSRFKGRLFLAWRGRKRRRVQAGAPWLTKACPGSRFLPVCGPSGLGFGLDLRGDRRRDQRGKPLRAAVDIFGQLPAHARVPETPDVVGDAVERFRARVGFE